ncbi:glycosyltransferase family 2 protein [Leptolyngbya sp. NIES-2104]|uniref:glycosyltransferase family 2 protein n=1 Tax=Leptolyngbya sp. NIES-2104 TaxID=1552121 RepID=UPI0006ECBEBF|nr:glycosyltransferase family 2 protein [Leptolyngbya sp. NIES-2104]GAP97599.1 glycosyl transferase, family 2 [Leptolyngbya sp. NIES-2104]
MKISVLTPVYNGEQFIAECIENVIAQNCPNVEHIIADGGSKDHTVAIIRQYAERYPHIRWFSEPDRGQSDAMNKALKIAEGEIIGVLNIDDLYEPNALNTVLEQFTTLPVPSLLVGNCWVWDEQSDRTFLNRPNALSLTNLLIGRTHLANPAAYFYHASLHQQIGDYKVEEHYAMDVDFVLKASMIAHLKYIDVNLGRYRIYANTKTAIDAQVGLSKQRYQTYLQTYTDKLPLTQRWIVQGLRSLRNLRVTLQTSI